MELILMLKKKKYHQLGENVSLTVSKETYGKII